MRKFIMGTLISIVSIAGCYIGGYVTGKGIGEMLTDKN